MKNRAFALFAVGIFVACGGALWWLLTAKPRAVPVPSWSPPRIPVERVRAPVPPRFSAPLPTRLESFWQEVEKGPPLGYVHLRLLEGDRQMGERFLSALRQAASKARDLEELRETYGEVLWPERGGTFDYGSRGVSSVEPGEPPCGWLVERLSDPGEEHPFVRELFWSKLALCEGPEVEALFAREEAPLPLVLENYHRHGLPRLTDAMRTGVRRLLAEDRQELFGWATSYLSRSEDPAAPELIEALARQARGEVSQRVHDARTYDQRRDEYHQRTCQFIPTLPEGVDELRLAMCLELWARTDWGATARLASTLTALSDSTASQRGDVITLTRFTSIAARDAWAREGGLLPASLPESPHRPGALVFSEVMFQEKRGLYFFPSRMLVDYFPVRHDELLANLAWLVRPELEGLAFEEIPPPWDDERLEAMGDYTLRAYVDGERFSVQARSLEEWWDVGAVLALLNEVLAARGSSTRFAASDSLNPTMNIVFGPEAGLKEAHAVGLLRLGDGSQIVLRLREQFRKSVMRILGQTP